MVIRGLRRAESSIVGIAGRPGQEKPKAPQWGGGGSSAVSCWGAVAKGDATDDPNNCQCMGGGESVDADRVSPPQDVAACCVSLC